MPTLYVSNSATNGFAGPGTVHLAANDGNTYAEAQSKLTPFSTIAHAYAVAVAGDEIRVNAGTYSENSGSGFLLFNRIFASFVSIKPDSGVASDVQIQGTAATPSYEERIQNASHLLLQNLTFGNRTGPTGGVIVFPNVNTSDNITIEGCRFLCGVTAAAGGLGISVGLTSGSNSLNNIIIRNNFFGVAAGGVLGSAVNMTKQSTDTFSNISITGNTIACTGNSTVDGILVQGGSTITISGNSLTMTSASAAYHGIIVGADASTGGQTVSSLTIANNYISTTNAHGILVGGGGLTGTIASPTATIYNNIVIGGLHAIVLKGAIGVNSYNNLCVGDGTHTLHGLYWKNAQNCGAWGNLAVVSIGSAAAFLAGPDAAGQVTNTVTLQGNTAIATAGAATFAASYNSETGSTTGTGGTIWDYNSYEQTSPAVMESIRGTSSATISAAVTAWSGYAVSGNDAHSALNPAYNATVSTTAGVAVYMVVKSASGGYWRSTAGAYENYDPANWADYALPLWEDSPGHYQSVLPRGAILPTPSYFQRASLSSAPSPSDMTLGLPGDVWQGSIGAFVSNVVV